MSDGLWDFLFGLMIVLSYIAIGGIWYKAGYKDGVKSCEPYSCNGGVHSGEQFEDGTVAE